MRTLLLAAVVSALALPGDAAAQRAAPERNQITLGVGVIGGSVGYARRIGAHRFLGADLGIGGDLLNQMVVGGRHFAEDFGFAYEQRDAFTDKLLFEIAHVNVFVRHQRSNRWQVDTGLRASVFLHFDSSDDDPGGGGFAGAYITALYGWRHFKVGPRVLVGAFTEGRPEFGINVAPLTGRVVLPW